MDNFAPDLSSIILDTALNVAEKLSFIIEPAAMDYLASVASSPRALNRLQDASLDFQDSAPGIASNNTAQLITVAAHDSPDPHVLTYKHLANTVGKFCATFPDFWPFC